MPSYLKHLLYLENRYETHIEKIHVFVKHYVPSGNPVQYAISITKVKVKATRSLTSFEMESLVEYISNVWSLYLLPFESYIVR